MRKINTILHTKDGSVIGNAIIINVLGADYSVKTDYGDVLKLSEKELLMMFKVSHVDIEHKHSVDENRIECRNPVLFRKKRISLGITQAELANKLGLKTHMNISRFENGVITSISNDRYKQAMKVFDLYEDDEVLD